MSKINFFIEDIKFSFKNKPALREWLEAAAKKERFKIEQLNYILCPDRFLLNLNQHYLHHDDFTDIITFDLKLQTSNSTPQTLTGDIFISIERVKENAKHHKTTFQNELHLVMIHGVLHLCGYKDKTKEDKNKMRAKENYYLNLRSFL